MDHRSHYFVAKFGWLKSTKLPHQHGPLIRHTRGKSNPRQHLIGQGVSHTPPQLQAIRITTNFTVISTTISTGTHAMFNLKTIPNEILIEIFCADSTTSHLCSVSLVSRRFHNLVAPILYKHVQLVKNDRPQSQIQLFLRTILSRPVVASYVRQLEVQWVDTTRSSLADTGDLALFTTAARTVPLFHWMASPTVPLRGQSHCSIGWPRRVPRSRWYYTCFREYGSCSSSRQSQSYTVYPMSSTTCLKHTADLTSVRDITLETSEYRVSDAALLALLKLPCICSLHLPGATDGFSATAEDMGISAVTKLSFGCGTIHTPCLARILALPSVLRHFSFVDSQGSWGSFNGVVFMAAMQRFRNTLQALELRFGSAMMRWCDTQPDEVGTLGELRGWPVLRRLRCPFTLLLGHEGDVVLADVVLADLLTGVLTELVLDPDGYCTYPQGLELVIEMLEGGRCRHLVKVCVAWPASVLLRSHTRRRMELTPRGNALMTRVCVLLVAGPGSV